MQAKTFIESDATFDARRVYRYTLTRRWGDWGPRVAWVMLNPSTADERVLDPTLRRCMGYSQVCGAASMVIVNAYALRSTNPRKLWEHPDPVGPENDKHIVGEIMYSSLVVVGWGANIKPERERAMAAMLRLFRPVCLGVTKGGHPRHPLYLRKTAQFVPWEGPDAR